MNLDLDKLVHELSDRLGEQLAPAVTQAVDAKIRELGLDRVERKLGLLPPAEPPPAACPTERARLFLRSAILRTDPGDEVVRKALSESTAGAGGYLVPTEYRAELLKRLPELSELFPYVRRIPVSTDSGEFPKLVGDVSIAWGRAENDDIGETAPAFTQLTWTVRNMSAITYMSRELVDDANPGIVELVTDLFAEAVAAERDRMIATGNGTTQPEGIYSAAGLEALAVDGALTYAKLVELKYTLPRKYHRNARWVMNSTNLQRITALVDNNGQPILRDALVAGETPRILGKPFSIQDDLPDPVIFFGDLSQYLWFDRQRLLIESTTTGGDTFARHQVAVKVVERCDGKLGLAAAFVKATGITS